MDKWKNNRLAALAAWVRFSYVNIVINIYIDGKRGKVVWRGAPPRRYWRGRGPASPKLRGFSTAVKTGGERWIRPLTFLVRQYLLYNISMSNNCIFCAIASGDKQAQLVYQDDYVAAFKDLNPQAPTHILVVPLKHIGCLSEADADDVELLGRLQFAIKKITDELGLKDYRVVMNNGRGAGQSVPHLHYHIMSGRRFLWPAG